MWILKYCKGNQSFAEEIFSQTIIKCWQKIKTFKGESKFSTWANCIARRNFLDEYRKNTRYEIINLDSCSNLTSTESKKPDDVKFSVETHPEYSAVDNLSPSRKIETLEVFNESKDLAGKIMAKLSYNDRNILRLYHYDNLEYKQISKMLKIPVGTVMSRLIYARRIASRILKLFKKRKIKQLTKIVRENLKIKNPTVLEQHELDETLDRLHKYHGRKNLLQEYVF